MLTSNTNTLKHFSFRCARFSRILVPERIPTKREIDEKGIKMRKLMLLNKEKRAKMLAEMEAQEDGRRQKREAAEEERRKDAATGIYRCLLKLKQPVQAAEAARMRLRMCQTEDEHRKVWFCFISTARCSSVYRPILPAPSALLRHLPPC